MSSGMIRSRMRNDNFKKIFGITYQDDSVEIETLKKVSYTEYIKITIGKRSYFAIENGVDYIFAKDMATGKIIHDATSDYQRNFYGHYTHKDFLKY
jgi:hypothetical protein